jgi:hypothetical protein
MKCVVFILNYFNGSYLLLVTSGNCERQIQKMCMAKFRELSFQGLQTQY